MRILVTGTSGYIGSSLAPRLLSHGHELRGMSRSGSGSATADFEVVRADAVSGRGLDEALNGIEVAYYLIHSMEPSVDGSFDTRERRGAENFAAAARAAGVQRIVYLGGLVPEGTEASQHLSSRLEVELLLLAATPSSVAFRASIVIGARSSSFRFMVRLIERLPLMPLPAWRDNRTQPIDERDVIELLARAADAPAVGGRSLDIAGPDVVTYADLLDRIRDAMLVSRPAVSLHRLALTPIASRVAAVIAGQNHELIGPLMEGLGSDLLPRSGAGAQALGVRMHSLNAAIERALRVWERTERLAAR